MSFHKLKNHNQIRKKRRSSSHAKKYINPKVLSRSPNKGNQNYIAIINPRNLRVYAKASSG